MGHMGSVRDVPGVPGLWVGKDSGIVALHSGTHGTCPGGPGNLRREGQCVWDCIQHRTLWTFLNLFCKRGPVGFLGIVTANLDMCDKRYTKECSGEKIPGLRCFQVLTS